MQTVRKVTNGFELEELAAAGVGFVIDTFNRRWHRVSCPRVLGMTVGEPKWFAATPNARDDYLRTRLTRYPTAKAIRPCGTCADDAIISDQDGRYDEGERTAPGSAVASRGPHIEDLDGGGFLVWADGRVRNESKAESSAGMLRQSVARRIRDLPEPGGRLLYATYAGERPRGTDVENLLFNNIDQTLSLFDAAGRGGVRFEDLGLSVPRAPAGADWRNFYSYRLICPGEPWARVVPRRLICRVRTAPIPAGPARISARIWLAVGRALAPNGPEATAETGRYMLKVVVRGLEPARNLKALVDGVSAALQRDDHHRVTEAVRRLSELLDLDAEELTALATRPSAPLGLRSRSGPTSRQALLTLDGEEQVRVTPDDDRCVAAEVVTSQEEGPPSLDVEAFSVTFR